MSGSGSLYPYPRGKTPEQLYETLRALSDTLNRLRASEPASAATVAELEASVAAVSDQLIAVIADLGDGGLTEQQAFVLSLVTAVEDVLGSFGSLVSDSVRRSQEIADAAIRAALKGHENAASITTEQTVRKTANESFASQISTINASLSNANAAITEEITARADGDTANATSISTLSTTVSGHTSTLTTIQESVDGVESRYGVVLTQNGEVTGLMQLDGTLQGTAFTVLADTFQVGNASELGGDAVPVFTIDTVSGSSKVALRGDMIADGSITAQAIAANTITANQLAANAISTQYVADPTNTFFFDFVNGRMGRTDGTVLFDLKNKRLKMTV